VLAAASNVVASPEASSASSAKQKREAATPGCAMNLCKCPLRQRSAFSSGAPSCAGAFFLRRRGRAAGALTPSTGARSVGRLLSARLCTPSAPLPDARRPRLPWPLLLLLPLIGPLSLLLLLPRSWLLAL